MPFWSKDNKSAHSSQSLSVEELLDLAKRYVIQETVGPLKRIAKVLGIGLGGAIVTAIGAIIVLVGLLRVLQTETGTIFAGDWTFAPYLITALAGGLIIAIVGKIFMMSLRVPPSHADVVGSE